MGAKSGKIAMTNRLRVVACGQVYTLCVGYLVVVYTEFQTVVLALCLVGMEQSFI